MAGNKLDQGKVKKPRGPGHRFKPGQSGNPSGRPIIAEEVKKLAAVHTLEALKTIYDLMMHSTEDRTRLAAASLMLDRAYGKPSQAVTGEDGGAIKVQHSGDHILAMLKKLAGEPA